jgi:hypothetical protein
MADLNAAGVYVGAFSGETQTQLNARYPGIQIGELETVVAQKEAMLTTEPMEISEDVYVKMLEVLPPDDWQRDSSGSSFKMCEHLSGRITAVYAFVNGRHFTFNDVATLGHAAIMQKVGNSMSACESVPS